MKTPYIGKNGTTVYPFMAGGLIADGKICVYNKNTPTALNKRVKDILPRRKDRQVYMEDNGLNMPVAVAEGYLMGFNNYDALVLLRQG